MALKLLVVDPDEKWASEICDFLKSQMYDVDLAYNGKDAQLNIYNNKYFAAVLNYGTKNHSAAEVLKFIKANKSSLRVVVTFDSAEHMEQDGITFSDAKKLGVMEIMQKPIDPQDLKVMLEGHQTLGDMVSNLPKKEGVSAEEEIDLMDDMFTKVSINEFYSSKAVLFNVYVKLRENRYVKILHAGDSFSAERIQKYKEKKIEYLYFHSSDRRKFVQFNNFLAKKAVNNKKFAAKAKVNLLKNVSKKFLEDAFQEGLKPQVIEQGKEVCENIYAMVEKENSLYKVLRDFQDFDPNAFSHAYLVSLFTTAIIKQFEWESKTMIETAAFACFFHDIGKMKLPADLRDVKVSDMTDEQLAEYKKHPDLGLEIVEDNSLINNIVKQIILQHHEAYDGTGFPGGLKGKKIHTLANIVGLADAFAGIVEGQQVRPVEALKLLLGDKELCSKFNSLIVQNLMKVFVNPEIVAKTMKKAAKKSP